MTSVYKSIFHAQRIILKKTHISKLQEQPSLLNNCNFKDKFFENFIKNFYTIQNTIFFSKKG